MSPGSETADRVVKPNEYARAEIPHYWRIETDPDVVIYTYQLAKGSKYVHTGTFAVGETVAAPGLEWASVEVAELSEED